MVDLAKPKHFFLLGLTGVFSLACGAGLLLSEVLEGETRVFDTAVLMALRTSGNPADPLGPAWFEEAARDVTSLGSFVILFAVVAFVAIYLFLQHKPRNAWFLVLSSLSGTLFSSVLKALVARPRPEVTGVTRVFTASFPSGHALASAVVYLTIGVFVARAASSRNMAIYSLACAALLTFSVGMSRIYLGVHYPTDVLAGWLIGTGWALMCWLIAEKLMQGRARGQRLGDHS